MPSAFAIYRSTGGRQATQVGQERMTAEASRCDRPPGRLRGTIRACAAIVFQIVTLAGVVMFFAYIVHNTMHNLATAGHRVRLRLSRPGGRLRHLAVA